MLQQNVTGMNRPTLLSFVLRYAPLFAVGCAVFMVVNSWSILVEGFDRKPIVLRGLNELHLPVIAVESGFILSLSLVVGIGCSFIYWLLKYQPVRN